MTLVYLGGPIDLVSGEERTAWREKFAIELASRGMSSYNPASAFRFIDKNKDDASKLITINREAMLQCDMAIFVMSPDKASIGTPIELYMAHQEKIPHLVIWSPTMDSFDGRRPIPERLPAYIGGLADHVVSGFGDALDYIVTANHKA